ncbi:hypothetical protein [Paenimyroides aestuarii]|uniref:Uncharacterized protein n=1 Tax=Paenimyroides aestuarii TaxID=2968490 RepID=A0ABY5NTP5_9FLAO|nr:hypothetical protein [Paenimyroides aestuarii]UUV21952.1 hypothetical protein NPX36_02605 [Paenimyroides aestuarii]
MRKNLIKFFILSLLIVPIGFTACESDNALDLTYSNDSKKIDNAFLKEHVPKISGSWKIEKMAIVPNNGSDMIKNDTVLYNVGRIDVNVEEKEMRNDRFQYYLNGTIYINQETIPFTTSLIRPNIYNQSIFAFAQVGNNYIPEPVMNFDDLPEEYQFLADYFFGDTYEIFFSDDGETITWHALNRSAKEIILTKID